ncbi:hypothetical protein BO71DRAFT_482323 [Aspergillus ellipticus CBS 707.79]|uniref:Uncharacterized protein n=1 Tax=Aspergillus ellipticus CBS 707.79 TaxID=1448320 RepID=A0A319EWV4_9EURO|nr:hypothetical protein BO71DRAFT_482323 [Aspergillus ellipticus CBS 707.79]
MQMGLAGYHRYGESNHTVRASHRASHFRNSRLQVLSLEGKNWVANSAFKPASHTAAGSSRGASMSQPLLPMLVESTRQPCSGGFWQDAPRNGTSTVRRFLQRKVVAAPFGDDQHVAGPHVIGRDNSGYCSSPHVCPPEHETQHSTGQAERFLNLDGDIGWGAAMHADTPSPEYYPSQVVWKRSLGLGPGYLAFAIGAVRLTSYALRWISSLSQLPFLEWDDVARNKVAVGICTVDYSRCHDRLRFGCRMIFLPYLPGARALSFHLPC